MCRFGGELLQRVSADAASMQTRNIDVLRYPRSRRQRAAELIDRLLAVLRLRRSTKLHPSTQEHIASLQEHWEGLEWLYERLADEQSRKTLIEVLSYRVLGNRHTRLSTNNSIYYAHLSAVTNQLITKRRASKTDILDGWIDEFTVPGETGQIRLKAHKLHVMHTFLAEQYKFVSALTEIKVSTGEVIVDGGGCWGDTALYFADKCGSVGQVHVFEFSHANLKLLRENLDRNPALKARVHVHERALWDTQDLELTFTEHGPATRPFDGNQGGTLVARTDTIDNWFNTTKPPRVDFIKLDVEGSEERCILGSSVCIKQFRPKIAVAVYHSLADFVTVPAAIDRLNPTYKLYLGHYTIQSEETVLFAV